jgi:6-phosphogluconolactonase
LSELIVLDSPERAARAAAERIAAALERGLAQRGTAHLALAGGATPRRCYELLSTLLADWSAVQVWFGDERAVGPEDADSNFRIAAETLLAGASVPPRNVHRIQGERGAEDAASAYDALLRDELGKDGSLDVAVQGLGADAHTASLFPGNPALEARDRACVPVHDAPKPPPDRITLTVPILAAARSILFLVTGGEKRDALGRALAEPDRAAPASLLGGPRTTFVVDAAAAPR